MNGFLIFWWNLKIPKLDEKVTFGAFMTIIRSSYSDYLFTYFQLDDFRRQISTSKTATINQITKAMLDKVSLPIPPMVLQEQFAAFVQQSDKSKLLGSTADFSIKGLSAILQYTEGRKRQES